MRRIAVLLALLLATLSGWYALAPPGPEAVLADIERDGAKSYVLSNFETSQWDSVIKGIESGNPGWLKVAGALVPGVDADSAEELGASLAHALVANPDGTLRLFLQAKGTEILILDVACFSPSQEASDAEMAQFRQAANKALDRVRDPALGPLRAGCRSQLAKKSWSDR